MSLERENNLSLRESEIRSPDDLDFTFTVFGENDDLGTIRIFCPQEELEDSFRHYADRVIMAYGKKKGAVSIENLVQEFKNSFLFGEPRGESVFGRRSTSLASKSLEREEIDIVRENDHFLLTPDQETFQRNLNTLCQNVPPEDRVKVCAAVAKEKMAHRLQFLYSVLLASKMGHRKLTEIAEDLAHYEKTVKKKLLVGCGVAMLTPFKGVISVLIIAYAIKKRRQTYQHLEKLYQWIKISKEHFIPPRMEIEITSSLKPASFQEPF